MQQHAGVYGRAEHLKEFSMGASISDAGLESHIPPIFNLNSLFLCELESKVHIAAKGSDPQNVGSSTDCNWALPE